MVEDRKSSTELQKMKDSGLEHRRQVTYTEGFTLLTGGDDAYSIIHTKFMLTSHRRESCIRVRNPDRNGHHGKHDFLTRLDQFANSVHTI